MAKKGPALKRSLDEFKTYVTMTGKTLTLAPVSLAIVEQIKASVLQEFRARGEPVDPPWYEVKTAAGETERHVHDDKSATSPEEKLALLTHRQTLDRLEEERQGRIGRYILLDGVQVDPLGDVAWWARMKRLGVQPPTDPDECKLYWLENAAMPTPQDQKEVATRVLALSYSGLPEEVLRSVLASFRDHVGQGQAAS